MPVIKLCCMDGRVFDVDVKVAKVSRTLRSMMENLGVTDGEEIPLPKLDSIIFEKVLEWAERHKDDPHTDDPDEIRERTVHGLTNWDKEFLTELDQATLFELIMAANYLDIRELVDAACKTVADLINRKTPDDIRAVMGIKNNFLPEEEERIKEDHDFNQDI